MPNSEPKKTRPPLPNSPPPKTPPKPMSPKVASSIPDLQPPPKTTQPKLGAVAKTRTVSKPRLAYSESPQKSDTDTPTEKAARESTKHLSRSLPKRKTSLESMSSPSEEESVGDLRDRLDDRRNYRASLGSGRKQAKRHVTVHSGFDQMLQQRYYDQQVKASANSDYGRDRSDGSGQRTPDPDCERSSPGTRSRNPHWASERQDRSCNRSERSSPTQPERGRDSSVDERTQMRRGRRVAETLASLPTQRIRHFDLKFKGASHDRLPIRSLDERCTAAEQYRRWVDDEPTRGTELLPKLNRWITHFEKARQMPIHTVNLSTEGLNETRWWFEFLVEVKAIQYEKGTVFKDLLNHRG